MNKVVFTAGVLAVCVIGGLFFCAGLFFGTNVSVVTEEGVKATKKIESGTDVKDSFINKLQDFVPSSKTKESTIEQHVNTENIVTDNNKKDKSAINLDSLLNEIVASHDTTDACLTDDVKLLNKEHVTMNRMRRYVVFLGYFQKDMCEEISQLMMAKGYPMHIQSSKLNDNECFLFCGPFKKRQSSTNLIRWLKNNGFKNVRLLSHEVLQTENVNLEEFDVENEALQPNMDERRKRTYKSKKNKNVRKTRTRKKINSDDNVRTSAVEEVGENKKNNTDVASAGDANSVDNASEDQSKHGRHDNDDVKVTEKANDSVVNNEDSEVDSAEDESSERYSSADDVREGELGDDEHVESSDDSDDEE